MGFRGRRAEDEQEKQRERTERKPLSFDRTVPRQALQSDTDSLAYVLGLGYADYLQTLPVNVGYKPSAGRRASSSKYANPMNIDQIARLFPRTAFVMAHMGYPWLVEAWSVAHANPNVYLDIAGSGPWTEAAPVAYLALGGQSFIPIDFSRVIWGSDNCLPQAESIARAQVYLRQMWCLSEQRKQVFGGTAARLLRV